MTLVTLSNTITINPAFIADLVVDDQRNRITVTMHDGRTHSLPCRYGKSIWVTRDELIAEMNCTTGAIT